MKVSYSHYYYVLCQQVKDVNMFGLLILGRRYMHEFLGCE